MNVNFLRTVLPLSCVMRSHLGFVSNMESYIVQNRWNPILFGIDGNSELRGKEMLFVSYFPDLHLRGLVSYLQSNCFLLSIFCSLSLTFFSFFFVLSAIQSIVFFRLVQIWTLQTSLDLDPFVSFRAMQKSSNDFVKRQKWIFEKSPNGLFCYLGKLLWSPLDLAIHL